MSDATTCQHQVLTKRGAEDTLMATDVSDIAKHWGLKGFGTRHRSPYQQLYQVLQYLLDTCDKYQESDPNLALTVLPLGPHQIPHAVPAGDHFFGLQSFAAPSKSPLTIQNQLLQLGCCTLDLPPDIAEGRRQAAQQKLLQLLMQRTCHGVPQFHRGHTDYSPSEAAIACRLLRELQLLHTASDKQLLYRLARSMQSHLPNQRTHAPPPPLSSKRSAEALQQDSAWFKQITTDQSVFKEADKYLQLLTTTEQKTAVMHESVVSMLSHLLSIALHCLGCQAADIATAWLMTSDNLRQRAALLLEVLDMPSTAAAAYPLLRMWRATATHSLHACLEQLDVVTALVRALQPLERSETKLEGLRALIDLDMHYRQITWPDTGRDLVSMVHQQCQLIESLWQQMPCSARREGVLTTARYLVHRAQQLQ
eukprot:jgi/Chrzof1/13957/Cz08g19110.t1